MAKKPKKPKLPLTPIPADSKAFISGLFKGNKAPELTKEEQANNKENAILIEFYNGIDKMLSIIHNAVDIMKSYRNHDFSSVLDEENMKAWIYSTYVANCMDPNMRLRMAYILDPNHVDPQLSEKKKEAEMAETSSIIKNIMNYNTFGWSMKHLVSKKPIDVVDPSEDEDVEEIRSRKYHNGICVASAELVTGSYVTFILLKRDVLGVELTHREIDKFRKDFFERDISDMRIYEVHRCSFFFDLYMLALAKLGLKGTDLKKVNLRTGFPHQVARTAIGYNGHKEMTDVLINMWTLYYGALEQIKVDMRNIIEEHSKRQVTIFS